MPAVGGDDAEPLGRQPGLGQRVDVDDAVDQLDGPGLQRYHGQAERLVQDQPCAVPRRVVAQLPQLGGPPDPAGRAVRLRQDDGAYAVPVQTGRVQVDHGAAYDQVAAATIAGRPPSSYQPQRARRDMHQLHRLATGPAARPAQVPIWELSFGRLPGAAGQGGNVPAETSPARRPGSGGLRRRRRPGCRTASWGRLQQPGSPSSRHRAGAP